MTTATTVSSIWARAEKASKEVLNWLPMRGFFTHPCQVGQDFSVTPGPFQIRYEHGSVSGIISTKEVMLGTYAPITFQVADKTSSWSINKFSVDQIVWTPKDVFPRVRWHWKLDGRLNGIDYDLDHHTRVSYDWKREVWGDEEAANQAGLPERLSFTRKYLLSGRRTIIPWQLDISQLEAAFAASRLEELAVDTQKEFEGAVHIPASWTVQRRLEEVRSREAFPGLDLFYRVLSDTITARRVNPTRFVDIFLWVIQHGFYTGDRERFDNLVMRNTPLWLRAILQDLPEFHERVQQELARRSDLSSVEDVP